MKTLVVKAIKKYGANGSNKIILTFQFLSDWTLFDVKTAWDKSESKIDWDLTQQTPFPLNRNRKHPI